MGARSNRSSRSRREPRPRSRASDPASNAKFVERRKANGDKPDTRGVEIERRASTIPPAVVHAVFEVSPEPPPAPLETPPPPGFGAPRGPHHSLHVSKPPPPPRPSVRPHAPVFEREDLEAQLALLNGAAVPVLTAPPTDLPARPTPPQRPIAQWFGVGAAAVLVVLAGVVLGSRTRERPALHSTPSEPAALPEPAAANPTVAPRAAARAPDLELPTEPPGSAVASPDAPETTPAAALSPESEAASRTTSAPPEAQSQPFTSVPPPRPIEPAAPAPELPGFDAAAASSAITAAFQRAAACRLPTDPSGSVTVTLTYAPSGRVTTALVSGPFAGTRLGGCIAGHLRSARAPAFSGEYITVKRSVVLK